MQALVFLTAVALAHASGPAGWTLVWSDEFDSIDLDAKWLLDNISTCTDNMVANTVQGYDTTSASSGVQSGDTSVLRISPSVGSCRDPYIAVPGDQRVCQFWSSRLRSKVGFLSQPRGGATFDAVRIEASVQSPDGSFLSPSLWMLPSIQGLPRWTERCQWPTSGEMDLLAWSSASSTTSGFHFGPLAGCLPGHGTCRVTSSTGGLAANAFHQYAVEYSASSIRFEVDGTTVPHAENTEG